jgi:hypothetical protein
MLAAKWKIDVSESGDVQKELNHTCFFGSGNNYLNYNIHIILQSMSFRGQHYVIKMREA